MNFKNFLIVIFLIGAIQDISAQVIAKSDHGYTILIERDVAIDSKAVYQQFVKVGEWWDVLEVY